MLRCVDLARTKHYLFNKNRALNIKKPMISACIINDILKIIQRI